MFKKALSTVLPKGLIAVLKRLSGAGMGRSVKRTHPLFFPHRPGSQGFIIPKVPEKPEYHDWSPLPIPPVGLRKGYGKTVDEWLLRGQLDIYVLRKLLDRTGMEAGSAGRILDLGCASGRMIRWLGDLAKTCEIWGTDVRSSHVLWCKQYLSPPFHFATTTLLPQLPFEDHYFGLIYAGSVFTHIDDLADAWFQEVRRVLRPGGRLYITIHDRHTLDLLDGKFRRDGLNKLLRTSPEYAQYARSDFGVFSIFRYEKSQVFYDVDYLSRALQPFFRTLAVEEEAYWHQTGVVLERQ